MENNKATVKVGTTLIKKVSEPRLDINRKILIKSLTEPDGKIHVYNMEGYTAKITKEDLLNLYRHLRDDEEPLALGALVNAKTNPDFKEVESADQLERGMRLATCSYGDEPHVVLLDLNKINEDKIYTVRHIASGEFVKYDEKSLLQKYPYMYTKSSELLVGAYTFEETQEILEKYVRNNKLTLPQMLMSIEMMLKNSRGYQLYRDILSAHDNGVYGFAGLTDLQILNVVLKVFTKLFMELAYDSNRQEILKNEVTDLYVALNHINCIQEARISKGDLSLAGELLLENHRGIIDAFCVMVISGFLNYDFTYKRESLDRVQEESIRKGRTGLF